MSEIIHNPRDVNCKCYTCLRHNERLTELYMPALKIFIGRITLPAQETMLFSKQEDPTNFNADPSFGVTDKDSQ
jgi:hypothetical protein